MAKPKKTPRPKPTPPRGFRDYFGAEVTQRKAMLDAIAEVYHLYGFEALESSAVETVEALGKFLPDVDRPNEGVFAWQEEPEENGLWLALRYDLTAPLARVYAENRNTLPTPYRRYAMGPVWRNEKPGPGRFRQFYQCDADTVGTASVAADAEICAMLCDVLESIGIDKNEYVVRINNRKVLNGVLERAQLFDPSNADAHTEKRGIVLRAIDKLDRLGIDGVRQLLGKERKDESGDVTVGADLSAEQSELIVRFLEANEVMNRNVGLETKHAEERPDLNFNTGMIAYLRDVVGQSPIGNQGVDELEQIAALLHAQGYLSDRIVIDPSVVRGLGYYTGPVYEAELTFEITDAKGRKQQFGSVAGGGRYDDLVTRFTGQQVPATGVSVGVDRLLAALTAKGKLQAEAPGPVVITVMDRNRMADYQAICATLRQAGIRAEIYLGNPKNFGNQLKYADKRGSPAAIIQGSDEAERGVVQVKDLILGAKLSQDATVEEWKENPSQTEVPLDDLIREIGRIYRLHGLSLPDKFPDDATDDT